jgi:thymidylate kinase
MPELVRSGYLLMRVLEELECAGIQYCIAHGYEFFPDIIESDVDVIIRKQDLSRLSIILQPFGVTQWIEHESTAHFIVLTGKVTSSEIPMLQFDVSSDFRRDGFVILTENDFIQRRKLYKNNFWVPPADIEYIYYLTKKVGKTKLTSEHADRLYRLYCEDPERCLDWLRKYFPEDVVMLIQNASITRDWSSLDLDQLKKHMLEHSWSHNRANFIFYRIRDIIRRIKRVSSPTGLWIVFLGPDGSGKSSVLEQVKDDLLQGFRRTKTYHFRPAVLWKSKVSSDEVISHPHDQGSSGMLRSFVKVLACFFDWLVGYWLDILPRLIKSTLILVDRNFIDLSVDPLRHQINCPAWITNCLISLLPKPDLTIYLNVSPEKAISRKQEIPEKDLIYLHKAYLDAYKANPKDAFIVDADQSLDAVVSDVEKLILSYMKKRSITRLGL